MKKQIQTLLSESLQSLALTRKIPDLDQFSAQVEYSRDPAHGDFASNIAMVLAKTVKCNPRELATDIIQHLPASDILEKTELAGPGFINFFLKPDAYQSIISEIFNQAEV